MFSSFKWSDTNQWSKYNDTMIQINDPKTTCSSQSNTIARIFSRKPSLSTDGGFNDTSVQSGAHWSISTQTSLSLDSYNLPFQHISFDVFIQNFVLATLVIQQFFSLSRLLLVTPLTMFPPIPSLFSSPFLVLLTSQ